MSKAIQKEIEERYITKLVDVLEAYFQIKHADGFNAVYEFIEGLLRDERRKTLEEVWEVFGGDMRMQIEEIGECEDELLTKVVIRLKRKIIKFMKNNGEIVSNLINKGNE